LGSPSSAGAVEVVEGLAAAEQTQDLFAASRRCAVDLDEAGSHEAGSHEAGSHIVEAIATRAFEQDDAFARDLLLAYEARDARQVGGAKRSYGAMDGT
jgi:hypothetical protein